jgi:hypothetical protein
LEADQLIACGSSTDESALTDTVVDSFLETC